jgi:hypothetical protein
MLAAAAILLLVGITAVGLVRRASVADSRASSYTRATDQVNARLVPDAQTPAAARTRLVSELRRLKAAGQGPATQEQTLDASAALVDVLARWPREASASGLFIKTQSIQVTSSGITLIALIPAEADAEPMIAALRELPGWTLQQSQRTSAGGHANAKSGEQPAARLTLRFVPQRTKPLAGGAS